MNGNACPPEPCRYSFKPWSDCTKTCGTGTQTQEVWISREPRFLPKDADEEYMKQLICPKAKIRPCNVQDCPTPSPTPSPTPKPQNPTPAPPTPTPKKPCVCPACKDTVKKVNGRWPKNYVPCRKLN